VLAESQTFSPVAPDNAVFLPESAFAADGYAQALVVAESGATARAAADAIRETVNVREERVDLFELAAVVDEINDFFDLLSTFLLGLGAISLVVAGVSILNVMLMSTVERRQEIGVMRAVGVTRRDVLRVLLAEAGLIGAAGAAAGTLLTVLLVAGLVATTPAVDAALVVLDPTNGYYLLLALVFGVGVGIVSGAYPRVEGGERATRGGAAELSQRQTTRRAAASPSPRPAAPHVVGDAVAPRRTRRDTRARSRRGA